MYVWRAQVPVSSPIFVGSRDRLEIWSDWERQSSGMLLKGSHKQNVHLGYEEKHYVSEGELGSIKLF